MSRWRGMGRYRLPAPPPLPADEEALAECAALQGEVDTIGLRLKVAPGDALDEAWRLQRRQGWTPRLSACHALANANAAVYRARLVASGGWSTESLAYRIKEARALVEEARVAMMKAR